MVEFLSVVWLACGLLFAPQACLFIRDCSDIVNKRRRHRPKKSGAHSALLLFALRELLFFGRFERLFLGFFFRVLGFGHARESASPMKDARFSWVMDECSKVDCGFARRHSMIRP
jgi:hypothetical protein